MVRVVKRVVSCRLDEPRRRGYVDVRLEEAVVLDDGRRLTLRQDRGFSCSDRYPTTVGDLHIDITNTLLPDEPADPGQVGGLDEDWQWAIEALARAGVVETGAHLESVPLDIEYGPGLSDLLAPG